MVATTCRSCAQGLFASLFLPAPEAAPTLPATAASDRSHVAAYEAGADVTLPPEPAHEAVPQAAPPDIAQMPPLPCGTLPLEALETQEAPEFFLIPLEALTPPWQVQQGSSLANASRSPPSLSTSTPQATFPPTAPPTFKNIPKHTSSAYWFTQRRFRPCCG